VRPAAHAPARFSGAAVAVKGRRRAAKRVVVGAGDIGAMLSGIKKAFGQVWVVAWLWSVE